MGLCLTIEIHHQYMERPHIGDEDVYSPLPYIKKVQRRRTQKTIVIPLVDIWKHEMRNI